MIADQRPREMKGKRMTVPSTAGMSIQKIYVTAPLAHQAKAIHTAYMLMRSGYEIVSRWLELDVISRPTSEAVPSAYAEYAREWSVKDFEDLEKADTLVSLGYDTETGGKHVELGIALALRKQILITRKLHNIFYHHPAIVRFVDEVALLQHLQRHANFAKETKQKKGS